MPNRILREGILTSERVNALKPQAELFYRRLMSVVDDFGRYSANPALLRAACYPLRLDEVREADISRWLTEVQSAGLLALYAVQGKRYLEMKDFRQQIRAKESKFPQMPADEEQMRSTCDADAQHMHPKTETETETETKTDAQPRGAPAEPLPFLSGDFAETWTMFLDHRREIKKPLKPTGARALLKELAGHPEPEVIAALRKSIASGWQGVFFNGNGHGKDQGSPRAPTPEQLEAKRKAEQIARRELDEDIRVQREELAARKAREIAERSAA